MGPELRDDLDLASFVRQWSHLLLSHKHEEVCVTTLFVLIQLTVLSLLAVTP